MKTLTLILTLILALSHVAVAAQPPNIILILADDMGSGDLGCCVADPKILKTPHCDRVAKEGMRFTDASAPASICTPTRYAVLTGRYRWRTPRKFGTAGDTSPLMLHPKQLTTASLLESVGYSTACIGKWHLGQAGHRAVISPVNSPRGRVPSALITFTASPPDTMTHPAYMWKTNTSKACAPAR